MKKLLVMIALAAAAFGTTVTFEGKPVHLEGEIPAVGTVAPTITVTRNDLSEVTIGGASDKVRIVAFLPSIDTPVCSLESITFNFKIRDIAGVELYIISKDLPFAHGRFCGSEEVGNITTASAYKLKSHQEVLKYGVNIAEPFLQDLLTRAVFILDKSGKIVYEQIVGEITQEPDYDAVLEAAEKHL